MPQAIPLLIAIEQIARQDDDRMIHHLRIGVIGMSEPLTIRVESDFYERPRITEVWTHAGIDLPHSLQDAFIGKCFELLVPSDTEIAELVLPDATRWIKEQFSAADTQVLLKELRRHTTPGLLANRARHTSLIPVTLSSKGLLS